MKDVLKENLKKGSLRAQEALNENGLDIENIAFQMGQIAQSSQDESLRVKVLDTALKIHGALEPEKAQGNQIQIVFQFDGTSQGVAEILIPR